MRSLTIAWPSCYEEKLERYGYQSETSMLSHLTQFKAAYDRSKDVFLSYHRRIEQNGYRCFDIDDYTEYSRGVIDMGQALYHQFKTYSRFLTQEAVASTPQLTQQSVWLKDERVHHLWQISMILRSDFRQLFGYEEESRMGNFIDRGMGPIIHEYAYSVDYSLWDQTLIKHTCSIASVAVSSDGRYLFFGGMDNDIYVWDLIANTVGGKLEGHTGGVQCLDYKYGRLASGSDDSSIIVWDAYTLELITKLEGHTGAVYSACFNEAGDQVISASKDKTIRSWCARTGQCLTYFIGHQNSVWSAHFLGDMVISGSHDRSLKVWDIDTASDYYTEMKGIKGPISDVRINCDASLIACVACDVSITIFRRSNMEVFRIIPQISFQCRFHPFWPFLLAVTDSVTCQVKLFDVVNGEYIGHWSGHTNKINNLCFSPDGTRLMSVSNDYSIRLWDLDKVFS